MKWKDAIIHRDWKKVKKKKKNRRNKDFSRRVREWFTLGEKGKFSIERIKINSGRHEHTTAGQNSSFFYSQVKGIG